MMPDTGANKSIISRRFLVENKISYGTEKSDTRILTANKSSLDCSGSVDLTVVYEGFMTPINALVSANLREDFLVSWHDLRRMQIIPSHFPHIIAEHTSALQSSVTSTDTLESLCEEFADVFQEDTLAPMKGTPMHVHLRRNDPKYKPLRVTTARRTPLHYKKEADLLIESLLASCVIEKVPANENVEWCSPGFFVPKPNGKVRLVTDFRQINQFIDRPVHPFPSCQDIIRGIKHDSQWFLKFDAVHGYFQVPLDAESARLTTFLVESGRYRFLRAPMGLNPSSDHFCARTDAAFAGVRDLLKIVDDGLLQAPTKPVLLKEFRNVLECCRKSSITLSKPKLQMGQSVIFAGHTISKDGVMPEPKRTDAIRLFPVPTNITELRGFLGLVNQLGVFVPDLAHVTQPLRGLLKKNVAYLWLPEHQAAFEKTKEILLSELVIKPYNPNLQMQLLTDASRLKGLGYALIQKDPEASLLSLIQCGSRSLISAESRYSTTELECLAIYYAITNCSFYVQGADFQVVTDHKPLVGTFVKPLSDIENARLLRYREKLAQFSFTVKFIEGKYHLIADAMSRAPVFDPPEEEDDIWVNSILADHIAADPALQSIYDIAAADDDYQSIVHALISDIDLKNLPPNHPARVFRSIWDDLSVKDDVLLIMNDSRLVVPFNLEASVSSCICKLGL